jgi:hypothetical protein
MEVVDVILFICIGLIVSGMIYVIIRQRRQR